MFYVSCFMRLAQVQFVSWDKAYNFDLNGLNLAKGDKVVVKTELGVEIGAVIGFVDFDAFASANTHAGADKNGNAETECECPNKKKCPHRKIKPVLRKATAVDLEKTIGEKDLRKAISYCKEAAQKYRLPMKVTGAHFSFDGSRVTFAFIADGRIDFRELVKDLTHHFNRTVRMQQIGIRDEAKVAGDYGPCGLPLCCARFLHELTSVTSEMAEFQQCAHRGSDRLSGICGRLKCCLVYEIEGYKELAGKLPPAGTRVNVDGQRGVIVGHHILKQSVDVEFPPEKEGDKPTVVEVDLKRSEK